MKEALQILDDAGHIAYVVGGSVRDFLLGRETKDHDIATSAGPDELCRLFPRAITVGKAFGVLKIPVDAPYPLEIASFRQDLEYKDHRHPTGILFAGPVEDAARRDFTVNALFLDPKTSRILDTVGGLADLKARVIRAIGNPLDRFKEDALRLLRAVRFTTTLGFDLEPLTAEAIRARARLISKVSAERVRDELTLMLQGPAPGQAFRLLSDLGLLVHVLPELEALKGLRPSPLHDPDADNWQHTLKLLDSLARASASRPGTLGWGALLHAVGKPIAAKKSEGKNFNGHEIEGARISRVVCQRMRLSTQETDTVTWLVEEHLKFKDVFQMREATLQRFIRQPHFDQLLALHRADALAGDGNLAFYEFCANRYEELRKSTEASRAKLITGADLIQLGMKPGPRFSEILRSIEDLAMERKLTTKEEALEYVIKHFVG